jgi:hypothetical protein
VKAPMASEPNRELYSLRYTRIFAESTGGGDARWQDGGQILRQARREATGQDDHHAPRHGQRNQANDQPAQQHHVAMVTAEINAAMASQLPQLGTSQPDRSSRSDLVVRIEDRRRDFA